MIDCEPCFRPKLKRQGASATASLPSLPSTATTQQRNNANDATYKSSCMPHSTIPPLRSPLTHTPTHAENRVEKPIDTDQKIKHAASRPYMYMPKKRLFSIL